MNMLGRTVLVLVMAIATVLIVARHHHADKVVPDEASGSASGSASPAEPTAKPAPNRDIRTVTHAEREQLAAQIAAAHAARAERKAAAAGSGSAHAMPETGD